MIVVKSAIERKGFRVLGNGLVRENGSRGSCRQGVAGKETLPANRSRDVAERTGPSQFLRRS